MTYSIAAYHQKNSYNLSGIACRKNQPKREKVLNLLEQQLSDLQTKMKKWLVHLPGEFPTFYLQQRLPLALIYHIQYKISHVYSSKVESLIKLNHIVQSYSNDTIDHYIFRSCVSLKDAIDNLESDFNRFIESLSFTYGQKKHASFSCLSHKTPQQVVTQFFKNRLQNDYLSQRRESQILFHPSDLSAHKETPRVKIDLGRYMYSRNSSPN